ncbi:MAG: tRNA dihydrouridine synthase [Sediminispirochaetaceae bacterium]
MTSLRIRPTDMLLAPMAEISHGGFRRLVADFGGCDWYFTEMLSAAAVHSTSPYSKWYFDFGPSPERTIVQIAGLEPDSFARAAERLRSYPIAGIDINMGCSVYNITKRGWGVELMKDPSLAAGIVGRVRSEIPDRMLSVKLRLGEQPDTGPLIRLCRGLADAGADFITLNPRTSKSNRDRPGNWDYVRILRDEIAVPVAGNGEIKDSGTYHRRLEKAGDGPVMIGRGAVQRPWIFSMLKGGAGAGLIPEGLVDVRNVVDRFFEYLGKYQPRDFHVSRARRFFSYFCDNFKFGTRLNTSIQNTGELQEMRSLVLAYLERNPDEELLPPEKNSG